MKKRGKKELIFEVLEHKIPAKVPFGEMHVDAGFIEKFMGRKYAGQKDDIEFSLETGRELIKPGGFWFGTKWRCDGKPFADVDNLMKFAKKVPAGLTAEMKGKVIEARDMAYEANLAMGVQITGILSYGWDMMGFENFLMDLYTEPEKAKEVINLIVERETAYALELAELGIEFVLLTDDIAGNDGILISPEKFREMIIPGLKKIIDACGDMYVVFHSDGNIEPVLQDMADIGIDGFQSIEYGQMDLKQTKEKYKNLALFGNVDMSVLHLGTPEEIDALVREAVETGSPGGSYAVCSDNSIPEFIPLHNFNAYVKAIKKYTSI